MDEIVSDKLVIEERNLENDAILEAQILMLSESNKPSINKELIEESNYRVIFREFLKSKTKNLVIEHKKG